MAVDAKGNSRLPQLSATGSYEAAFSTPITFYGKVCDQYGKPVPNATVRAHANGHPSESASKRTLQTDASGAFEIHGMRGISLAVDVSKDGYYQVGTGAGKIGSAAGFQYASYGGQITHNPDKERPVAFTLYKKSEVEPLRHVESTRVGISGDGIPVTLTLSSSGGGSSRQIVIRAWAEDGTKSSTGTYDWRAEIQPVDAGITTREGKFDFVAPETGYQPVGTIEMPGRLAMPNWQDVVQRSFFVRFDDGVFGRIEVRMAAPPHGSVSISGYLNPKLGSRNLESDPNAR